MRNLEADRRTIDYSQQISDRAYMSQKDREEQQKRELAEFLRAQQEIKARERQAEP